MVMSNTREAEFQGIVFRYGRLDTLARSVLVLGGVYVLLGMVAFVRVSIW